ncbi:MAG: undecaprenyldiphospho-muramoylpentapeptide beta-N-acetylglucosaminyltransferase [Gammaproteobacteria bacterium]|nr:undecaprenyldiphospho-muramoylpentapeptide beta-N-acetylglucosaminyltransferase [Gammaproteobacteria bacterium]
MFEKKKYKIIIAAGGTGGHIYPAIALAKKFESDGHRVVIIATGNDLEKKIFSQDQIDVVYFESRFKDVSRFRKYISLFTPPKADLSIYVRDFKPNLVLGMGGYASLDVCKSAGYILEAEDSDDHFMMHNMIRPYIAIHEQNSKAGRANRYIANSRARGVIEGFPGAFDWKTRFLQTSTDDLIFLGNPVRSEILDVKRCVRSYSEYSKNPRILVLGGSQGARSINYIIPDAVQELSREMDVEVLHQTGELDYVKICEMYKENEFSADIYPFIKDMAKAYAWADLVIGRSGAMTISELSAVGIPSILIPYPHAMDNHQLFNARFLEKKKAAVIIEDKKLNSLYLTETIKRILSKDEVLKDMAEAAFDETFVNASENITQFCYKMIEKSPLVSSIYPEY